VDGAFVPNPLVETQRYLDEFGRIVHGEPLAGAALAAGKAVVARGAVDLSLLDAKVEAMCTKLMTTFPECLTKSFEELRKPKIDAWNRNKENSRAWLALNMMAEARTGFRAFNEGPKNEREIDFVALRQRSPTARVDRGDDRGIDPQGGDSQGGRAQGMSSPLKVWFEREGRLLRLRLDRPKANILDAAMVGAIENALVQHGEIAELRGISHRLDWRAFQLRASIEEHLPGRCAAMLAGFHRLIMQIFASPVPVLTAIRGQCLGGGLELASAGHLLFASPDAKFGQPEIQIGVFAPAASCLLPERIGLRRRRISCFPGARLAPQRLSGSAS